MADKGGMSMGNNYLIAVDLEGIHGVVGEPYHALVDGYEYDLAVKNAIKEINAVAKALFDSNAATVAVWDNHGNGNNIDFLALDSRIVRVYNNTSGQFSRFNFQYDIPFDGVFYLGYHARAGTLNGVLSHTYSSKNIQYYKINGKQTGEFEFDSFIAAEKGIPALFIASDEACVNQVREFLPDIDYVVTKYGHGRNSAVFIEEEKILHSLYEGVCVAVQKKPKPLNLQFPCKLEARYTRMEDAEKALQFLQSILPSVSYGDDTHTLKVIVSNMAQLESFMWCK